MEGGTTVPHGTLLFIESLMFVDRDVVSKLNKEYREVKHRKLKYSSNCLGKIYLRSGRRSSNHDI